MENKNIQKTTAEESSDIFAVAEDQDKKNAAIDYAAFVMQLARPLVHDEKTYLSVFASRRAPRNLVLTRWASSVSAISTVCGTP